MEVAHFREELDSLYDRKDVIRRFEEKVALFTMQMDVDEEVRKYDDYNAEREKREKKANDEAAKRLAQRIRERLPVNRDQGVKGKDDATKDWWDNESSDSSDDEETDLVGLYRERMSKVKEERGKGGELWTKEKEKEKEETVWKVVWRKACNAQCFRLVEERDRQLQEVERFWNK